MDPTQSSPPSQDSRKRLNEIDQQIVRLLCRRSELLKEAIAANPNPQSDWHAIWVQQQNAAMAIENEDSVVPLDRSLGVALMKHVASATYHSVATRERVAYLGPIYSYSYLAALQHFGETSELMPVASIGAVFDEVNRKQARWGMVPIENSTDGRIVDTLTMFTRQPMKICAEVLLPIHHYLLGRCRRSEVREIYSKPQAISQCREWLRQHLPDAKLIEVGSTAAAARMAAEKSNVAAIASREAGIHHGLEVIEAEIEDNRLNVTRFAVIALEPAAITGNDKTSIMFRVPHKPGALADAMLVFRQNRLNLTWIESFPIPESPSEYLFFIELEGHQSQPNVFSAIEALRKQAVRLEILGSYPRAIQETSPTSSQPVGSI